jgi:hypothetical protein
MFMSSSQSIWLDAVTLHSLPRDNMATSGQDMSYHCIWCPLSNIPHKNCDRWSWWLMLSLAIWVGTQPSSSMWWVVGMMWSKWTHWRPRQWWHWRTRYPQLQCKFYKELILIQITQIKKCIKMQMFKFPHKKTLLLLSTYTAVIFLLFTMES